MSGQTSSVVVRAGTEWRAAARAALPRFLFDYIDGSAGAGITTARNHADLAATVLPQTVLTDVGKMDLTTDLFGQRLSMPVALGPVGLAGLYSKRGEAAAARAAQDAGIPFTLSTLGVCSAEEVARAAAPPWFQLYMMQDRAFFRDLLHDVAAVGCSTLVLTVDVPVPGIRHADRLSGLDASGTLAGQLRLAGQTAVRPGWAWNVGLRGRPHRFGNILSAVPDARGLKDYWPWIGRNFDPSVDIHALEEVRALWSGTLLVKGVLQVEDARAVVAAGADGLIISNHGGRQLDGAESSIQALPAIVDAVGSQIEVHMDGGIRSGQDVLKAVSLGAKGTYIGRSMLYGLGAMGEAGVTKALEIIHKELDLTMAFCGRTQIHQVDTSILLPGTFPRVS